VVNGRVFPTPAAPRVQSTEELDEKRPRTTSGIAACGGFTAPDYRDASPRGAARRRDPMSDSFIGDGASAAWDFK
jgi:hypothetical protein